MRHRVLPKAVDHKFALAFSALRCLAQSKRRELPASLPSHLLWSTGVTQRPASATNFQFAMQDMDKPTPAWIASGDRFFPSALPQKPTTVAEKKRSPLGNLGNSPCRAAGIDFTLCLTERTRLLEMMPSCMRDDSSSARAPASVAPNTSARESSTQSRS